jgi:hypothetical protein
MKKVRTMYPPMIALDIVTLKCYEIWFHRQTLRERILDERLGLGNKPSLVEHTYLPSPPPGISMFRYELLDHPDQLILPARTLDHR